jgi:hypothetical protein
VSNQRAFTLCESQHPMRSSLEGVILLSNHNSNRRAVSQRHLPHTTCQTRSQHKTSLPLRTFQLCEFHCLFGADAHHFLFIQRDSNENALANLKQNLYNAFSDGEVRIHPRIYTGDDLANLQASCLDILECFSNTNDVVGYYVITGKIQVEPRASYTAAEDECEWFERAFSCAKYPEWGRLGGKIIDLEKERHEPNEDKA